MHTQPHAHPELSHDQKSLNHDFGGEATDRLRCCRKSTMNPAKDSKESLFH